MRNGWNAGSCKGRKRRTKQREGRKESKKLKGKEGREERAIEEEERDRNSKGERENTETVGKFDLFGATSMVICRRKTGGEGIIVEGNRAKAYLDTQETGHNPE